MPTPSRTDLAELTKELVKFRTTRDSELREAMDFLEDRFDDRFVVKRFEEAGKPSLLVSFRETMEPGLLLHGHLDVVEASDQMFEPVEKNERIYGRGAADMKAGVACLVKTMKDLDGEPDVALLLTGDEETGGFSGTGHLVEKGLEPEFALSAEPTENFPEVVVEQKGVLQLKLGAEGESAHGSAPGRGVNAAEKLMEIYREFKSSLPEGEYVTTVNLGTFSAGEEVNRVPDYAEMELDIRYTGEYGPEKVMAELEGFDIEVEVIAEAPMMKTDPDNPYVQALEGAIGREAYASDMRFFTARGVPAVNYGPAGYNIHSENEYVEIDSMRRYCKILEEFVVENFCHD